MTQPGETPTRTLGTADGPLRVLFVCHGNICRSPLAEGIFRHEVESRGLAERFVIDSAGVSNYHQGEAPHRESIRVARQYGVEISGQRSRPIAPPDFVTFDWLLAMDRRNMRDMLRIAPKRYDSHVRLMLDFGDASVIDVPDPYYGGADGFERVFHLLQESCAGLLSALQEAGGPTGSRFSGGGAA